MPRIDWNDADKYAGSRSSFFALADDGDKAVVRFYHKDMRDMDVIPVHRVEVDKRSRNVGCLRSPDSAKNSCPFCEAGLPVSVRAYLRLLVYSPDKDGYYTGKPECMIWERGASMRKQISSLINRYGKNGFMNKVFEIERCGKKGDQKTTYQIYPVDDLEDDECPIPAEDELDFPDVMEGIVMDKSFEDMEYFLENEEFPKEDDKPARNERGTRGERNTREERNTRTERKARNEEPEEDEEEEEAPEEQEEMPTGRRRRNSEPQDDVDDEPEPPRRRRRI